MCVCVCVCVCVCRQEDTKENTMQKNHRDHTLEKRKDLWFLTFCGDTDHSEDLMKGMDFSRKTKTKRSTPNIPNILPKWGL